MNTLTVPREITKGETLIIIPKKEYEELLNLKREKRAIVSQTLNEDLNEALEDVKKGRVVGPFSKLKDGLQALKSDK